MKTTTAIALAAGLMATPAGAAPFTLSDGQLGDIAAAGLRFTVTNRVSDQVGVAPLTDPLLVNPWGLSAAGPAFPLWVANNGTDTSTLYDQTTFAKNPLGVSVPGGPTGTTFVTAPNTSTFPVTNGTATNSTVFAFANQAGQILGWSPLVDPANALVTVDNSARGDIYTGLTLGGSGASARLFAADFGNGLVRVFDSSYAELPSFTDPGLPSGYGPFNVQVLNGQVYVAFAKIGEPGEEAAGQGLGFVSVFDTNGTLVRRLVQHGQLNAPWGLTIAPESFGKFAGALLVGNFGDGKINAYDATTGNFIGHVRDDQNKVEIDGLWALRTGPNGTVIFSAGPDEETHGLLGTITSAASAAAWGAEEHATMAEIRGH
jgi:uncharacterized protein (TIGR03118 family)